MPQNRHMLAALFVVAALFTPLAAHAENNLGLQGQGNGPVPPAPIGGPSVLVAQNQQSAAELMIRIQQLEELVRTLTGRVEGLEFQLAQMQTQFQKLTEDNEFRFQQLEGGAGKAPVKPQGAAPAPTPAPASEPAPAAPAAAPADAQQGGAAESPQPLDLSLNGGKISDGDAVAQYQAGYDAVQRGDYAFAEEQFRQFAELYPDDANAPDAVNYLGEALLQRRAYTDAAQVLADGYTKYKDSKRAPDMMLNLGIALAGAEQVDVACRTFFTVKQRYPDLSQAFKDRLAAEVAKAKCPVQ